MENNAEYINFPISFFTDDLADIKNTLSKAMNYAVFKHSLGLDLGTDEEKIKSAASFFAISFGNINSIEPSYNGICEKYNVKAPNISLRLPIMWEYYKYEKNEFQIACFRAFCAVKSILGDSEYCKTNKSMILARMFGRSKPNTKKDLFGLDQNSDPEYFTSITKATDYLEMEGYIIPYKTFISESIQSENLKAVKLPNGYKIDRTELMRYIKRANLEKKIFNGSDSMGNKLTNSMLERKYANRYHIDKVLEELQLSWGLKLYSDHIRGMYVSFTKSLDDLAVINELSKKSNKRNNLKEQKRQAKEFALKRLQK